MFALQVCKSWVLKQRNKRAKKKSQDDLAWHCIMHVGEIGLHDFQRFASFLILEITDGRPLDISQLYQVFSVGVRSGMHTAIEIFNQETI